MEEERLCPICQTVSKTPFLDGRDFYFLCLSANCPVHKIYGNNAVMLSTDPSVLIRKVERNDKPEES